MSESAFTAETGDTMLTVVTGCYFKGILNVRLRFGEPVRIQRISDAMTQYAFAPSQRFALTWWARLSPRRQVAGFAVAEALTAGLSGYWLPCVRPAVQVHAFLNCRCIGKDRGIVGRADELIRQIQQDDIDACRVPPIYFRLASQALRIGYAPRRINREELRQYLEASAHAN